MVRKDGEIMLAFCGIILLLAILTYDKWSYKAWYERCIKKGTGYEVVKRCES